MPDKIFIEGLEARCIIGIFDWERKTLQKITVDLEFPAPIQKAAKSDRVEHTIDYKAISKHTLQFIEKSCFQLVETLSEELAQSLLENFPLKQIRIRLCKPGALRGAINVGVEITRKKK